jgi:hypothetical protein
VSYFKGKEAIQDVWEQGAKGSSWSKKEEVTAGRKDLLNEEFHNLYPKPNIIRIMQSRRVRWADNVALVEGNEKYIRNSSRE